MKVVVVGNSHTSGLAGNWEHETYRTGLSSFAPSAFAVWAIPFDCWGITSEHVHHVVKDAIHLLDKDTTVLGFIGSSDIREHLVKYNNAAEIARVYASTFSEYFKEYGCKVGFIHPVPVTNDTYFFDRDPNYDKWGKGSREDILKQYAAFTEELLKHEEIHIPIVGKIIDSDFLSVNDTIDGCHLNPEKNQRLIEHVLKLLDT